ncbi:MAG: hypothetical protein HQL00_06585 [Nitrospirae bacterium]|nr:hypothetical protein [Nitrospirota bacterium]
MGNAQNDLVYHRHYKTEAIDDITERFSITIRELRLGSDTYPQPLMKNSSKNCGMKNLVSTIDITAQC